MINQMTRNMIWRQLRKLRSQSWLSLIIISSMAANSATAQVTIEASADAPIIELTISQDMQAAPDMATFSTGITSSAPTAQAALRENSAKVERLVAAIKAVGIDDKNVQTSGILLNEKYDYGDNDESVLTGYEVRNRLVVTLLEIDKLGMVLDALVAAGATDLNGPTFGLQDDNGLKQAARDVAMIRSKNQALDYAKKAGFSDVALITISEGFYITSPAKIGEIPVATFGTMRAVPISTGQVGALVTVGTRYKMVR